MAKKKVPQEENLFDFTDELEDEPAPYIAEAEIAESVAPGPTAERREKSDS